MQKENCHNSKQLELITMIVNFGVASKAIKIAKKNGVSGGTVFLGKGTIKSKILDFLELNDSRKEIVLMIANRTTAYQALDVLSKELAFHKPNHGIAFTIAVSDLFGSKSCRNQDQENKRGEETIMYQAVFTIVDRGEAENVIAAANRAGARGGTIIHARGSGIHETNTLFSMPIEPEKEIVLIICKTELTGPIVSAIKEDLHIEEPGRGIIFILDVNRTYGLFTNSKNCSSEMHN